MGIHFMPLHSADYTSLHLIRLFFYAKPGPARRKRWGIYPERLKYFQQISRGWRVGGVSFDKAAQPPPDKRKYKYHESINSLLRCRCWSALCRFSFGRHVCLQQQNQPNRFACFGALKRRHLRRRGPQLQGRFKPRGAYGGAGRHDKSHRDMQSSNGPGNLRQALRFGETVKELSALLPGSIPGG